MKRLLSLILVFVLLCGAASAEELSGFFGSLGDTINQALTDAGDAIDQALTDAGEAINQALTDTQEALGDAWDWTSEFLAEQGDAISEAAADMYHNLCSWIDATGEDVLVLLEDAYTQLSESLGMAAEDASETWHTVMEYAEEHHIDPVTIGKLTVALTVRLTLRDTLAGDMAGDYASEVIIDWFTELGIDTEADADEALSSLRSSLQQADANS